MTNELESVLERTTITFPKAISGEEFKKMLVYLASEYGYSIRCNVEDFFNVRKPYEGEETSESLIKENYTSKITGLITRDNSVADSTSFSGLRETEKADYDEFNGLSFFVPPEWTLADYRREELVLMDEIGRGIEKYFLEEPHSDGALFHDI